MDLKSGYPYWAIKNGLPSAFPRLETNLRCDVAVVGGGISGALIANALSAGGHDVVILEQRDIAWGSTSASTALLQYEIDTHLVDLARQFGLPNALLAYRACVDAIGQLKGIASALAATDFAMQDSLYYASRRWHRSTLRDEHRLRADNGFDVEWLDSDALRERYGFAAPGAILSKPAARVDPYRLTYRLCSRMQREGVRIFDRTCVAEIRPGDRFVTLRTTQQMDIRARHVVLANGYAAQRWLHEKVASNRSSYALITDPLHTQALGSLASTLVWESARPYLYLRTTGDRRLLLGGEDDTVDIPARRDLRVEKKSRRLLAKLHRLFPELTVVPAFAWAGTFAETKDGLPFFGPHPQHGPRVHFAMAYGGNGIVYSMLGADLLRALIERRRHPLAAFFSFQRLS